MAYASHLDIARYDDDQGLFGRILESIAGYRKYVETLNELNQLTDRELLDLNISRHAIRDIAREAVYGR
jgi:uncharacterized protein YjiS (DUF1127 family)